MTRLLILILLLSMFALTQDLGGTTSAESRMQGGQQEWTRYRVDKEGFSVLLPELPAVISRGRYRESLLHGNNDVKEYVAYADGVVYKVISFANPNNTDPLEYFEGEILPGNDSVVTPWTEVSNDDGIRGTRTSFKNYNYDKSFGYPCVAEIYQTNQRALALEAIGKDFSNPYVQRFIQSLELKDSPAGEEIGKGARGGPIDSEEKIDSPVLAISDVSVKAMILSKPAPRFPEEARRHKTEGTVSLRAIFSANGRVTNIEVVSGLPNGLTESVVEAARKIYFIPAMKDGRFVSTSIKLDYNFGLF